MIEHKIVGNAMQMVVCDLSPGEEVYCDAGKFLWKTSNMDMDTRFGTSKKTQEKKGFLDQAIGTAIDIGKRSLAGESLAFVYFTPQGGDGLVAFAQMIPGEIKTFELDGNQELYVQSDGLLAAESTLEFNIALTKKLGAGSSGGRDSSCRSSVTRAPYSLDPVETSSNSTPPITGAPSMWTPVAWWPLKIPSTTIYNSLVDWIPVGSRIYYLVGREYSLPAYLATAKYGCSP